MKNNAVIRIILFSAAILILISILLGALALNVFSFKNNPIFSENYGSSLSDNNSGNGDFNTSGSVDASKIKKIEIDWAAGTITVQPGDTDQIVFSESGVTKEENKMVWKLEHDELVIQHQKTKVQFGITGFEADSKDLVITVPSDWVCTELEINAASAEVNVSDLALGEVEISAASGVSTFTNCDVRSLEVNTASGDVNFVGTLNKLECAAASANCKITVNNTPKSVEMETASGNLELTLPADSGFICNVETLSGDFDTDFPITTSGGRYVHADASCEINMEAMSGDVTIRKSAGTDTKVPSSTESPLSCTDPNCTDASHNHAGTCTDPACTDEIHHHNTHHN